MAKDRRAIGMGVATVAAGWLVAVSATAQDRADLAKQLANPVASLISVPLQANWDTGLGPDDGDRFLLNVQPVVPFVLSPDWNLISRTILPVIAIDDDVPGGDAFGLGDTVQSLFFSPREPSNGVIWGVGPVLLLPTATEDALGAEQFGAGPTGVALMQAGPWTFGALVNHVWSVAGDDDRGDVNASFFQPFLNYTTPDAVTFFLNTEATYDWSADDAAVPVNAGVSKLFDVGGQKLQLSGGVRYWAASSDNGPEGFGARTNLVFLFPR